VELALQTKGELRLDPNKGVLGENAKNICNWIFCKTAKRFARVSHRWLETFTSGWV